MKQAKYLPGYLFVALCLASLFLPLAIGQWYTVALLVVAGPALLWWQWKELD